METLAINIENFNIYAFPSKLHHYYFINTIISKTLTWIKILGIDHVSYTDYIFQRLLRWIYLWKNQQPSEVFLLSEFGTIHLAFISDHAGGGHFLVDL